MPFPSGSRFLSSLVAMHAPDRLFSMPVNVVFGVFVAAFLVLAMRRVARHGDHRTVPMMGIAGAFIFAAQMLNFPIASGTTGHLLGGTLAAILLGPWAGTIVMAAVAIVQAVVFQDGGITVLGPNIFNMGMVGTLMAYFVYRAALGRADGNPARVAGAAFFSGWLAVVLASVFASVELAVSGTAPLDRVLPAMVFTHMLIGVGEGLITAAVVVFVLRSRPDLLHDARVPPRPVGRPALVTGLGAALACAAGLSLLPVLWDYPDGLESVGITQGFIAEEPDGGGERVAGPATPLVRTLAGSDAPPFGILPDYSIAGVNALAGTSLAGGIGAVLMFGLSFGVGRALVRSPRSRRRGRAARRTA